MSLFKAFQIILPLALAVLQAKRHRKIALFNVKKGLPDTRMLEVGFTPTSVSTEANAKILVISHLKIFPR